jgi:hypothetical protein
VPSAVFASALGVGNVYVTGKFLLTADFGAYTHTSASSADGFVVKLNSTGAVLWPNRWGETLQDCGSGVGIDSAGNVYVASSRNDDS